MDPIRFFVHGKKVKWGLPLEKVSYFSDEQDCSIPFDMYGEKEACRYEIKFNDIPLYVSPVFNEQGFYLVKTTFEQGDKLGVLLKLNEFFTADCGPPVYECKEIWEHQEVTGYPCVIWVLEDAILELGVHMDKKYIVVGYIFLTWKKYQKTVYDEAHLNEIGWDPGETLN